MNTLTEVLAVIIVGLLAILGFVGGFVGMVILGALLYGWIIMVIQGAVVGAFGLSWATWSFGQSILIGIVLSMISNIMKRGQSSRSRHDNW